MGNFLRRYRWLFAAAVVASLGVAAWIALQPPALPPGTLEVSGRIEGDQAAVGARIGGRVVRMAAREGSRLEAGEIIAELSSDQAKARLEQAEYEVHNAREQLRQARSRIATLESEVAASETAVVLAERESRAERDYSRYRDLV